MMNFTSLLQPSRHLDSTGLGQPNPKDAFAKRYLGLLRLYFDRHTEGPEVRARFALPTLDAVAQAFLGGAVLGAQEERPPAERQLDLVSPNSRQSSGQHELAGSVHHLALRLPESRSPQHGRQGQPVLLKREPGAQAEMALDRPCRSCAPRNDVYDPHKVLTSWLQTIKWLDASRRPWRSLAPSTHPEAAFECSGGESRSPSMTSARR